MFQKHLIFQVKSGVSKIRCAVIGLLMEPQYGHKQIDMDEIDNRTHKEEFVHMFQIIFAPKDSHSARISSLSQEKIKHLCSVLIDIVTEIFPQFTHHNTQWNLSGKISITLFGVSPASAISLRLFAQKIENALSILGLDELYEISNIANNRDVSDCLLAPEITSGKEVHYPETLIKVFDLTNAEIPPEFVCPITARIMHNPAYLRTNPKVNYEYNALMKWTIENETDPTTRKPVSELMAIKNNDLRKKINSFVMDMVLGKSVQHYFESERRDEETRSALSSNTATLFGNTERLPAGFSSLTQLFSDLKLSKEFYSLAAKGLRRAVFENKTADIERLFAEFGANNIINLQDENPASAKTALHVAISRNHAVLAVLLLSRGARSDIADASGETAESMARKSNNDAIKGLFRVSAEAAATSPHS